MIPALNWTIIIYFGCYIFWIVNYILATRENKDKAMQFALSDIYAKVFCFICYVIFPTTMVRPEVVGDGIFDNAVQNAQGRSRYNEKAIYWQQYDPNRKHRKKDKPVVGHYS